ncbi:hypothetical protein JWG44_08720 [Leptospira sp. 201903071]|nr:hypothetical protein [Leptospira ainazelensis]
MKDLSMIEQNERNVLKKGAVLKKPFSIGRRIFTGESPTPFGKFSTISNSSFYKNGDWDCIKPNVE